MNDISGAAGSEQFWTLDVPAGVQTLRFTLSAAASGDADPYVRVGAQPTDTAYDCRPYLVGGSIEACTIPNPQADTHHVYGLPVLGVHGRQAFTGVNLTGNY